MIKNKVDFKLINTALIVLIIYLIYQTKDFWFGILSVVGKIIFPFFIAFVLAYAIYPLVRKLVNKKIPKPLAIIIVVFGILAVLGLLISLITPLLTTQMRSLFDGIVTFLKELSVNYNVNFKDIQDSLSVNFDNILEKLGTYISNGNTKNGLIKIFDFISYSNKYFDENTPWILFNENKNKCEEILYNCCNIIFNINNLLKPYLVHTTIKVEKYLNSYNNSWDYKRLDKINISNNIEPLFIRYDKNN